MTTHTPGPWIGNAEQVFGNGCKIASVNDANPNCLDDRDLIAAAPDLLAALKLADTILDGFPFYATGHGGKTIRAAIAKAEGGQS